MARRRWQGGTPLAGLGAWVATRCGAQAVGLEQAVGGGSGGAGGGSSVGLMREVRERIENEKPPWCLNTSLVLADLGATSAPPKRRVISRQPAKSHTSTL